MPDCRWTPHDQFISIIIVMDVVGQRNEFGKALHKLVWTISKALNRNYPILLLSIPSKSVYWLADMFCRTFLLSHRRCLSNFVNAWTLRQSIAFPFIYLHTFCLTKETTNAATSPTDHWIFLSKTRKCQSLVNFTQFHSYVSNNETKSI